MRKNCYSYGFCPNYLLVRVFSGKKMLSTKGFSKITEDQGNYLVGTHSHSLGSLSEKIEL